MKQIKIVGLTIGLALLTSCVTSPPVDSRIADLGPASLATVGAYELDVVTGDKSQMPPAHLSEGGVMGFQNKYFQGPNGPTRIENGEVGGNHYIQIRPPVRKPIRLTIFGLSEPLIWSIEDSAIADMSASGREAFLDFKKDGDTKIFIRSGDNTVLRLGVSARTFINNTNDNKSVWQVEVDRKNEAGEMLFIQDGRVVKLK